MIERNINDPIFHDAAKAREYLESVCWPNGAVCPHCHNTENVYKLNGKAHRDGLYKCSKCHKQFTVTVGTLFERSKVSLDKWLMTAYLLCASKKGHSSHQIHRMIGVTYKTAWFMTHRIREAMKDPVLKRQLGGPCKAVEVDETFWGNKKKRKGSKGRGYHHKEKIFSLVERGGRVRSFHVPAVTARTLRPIMREQIHEDSVIMTDDMDSYKGVKNDFLGHGVCRHSTKEYVRGAIHTNTIENYFSILKRGLTGIYQHVGEKHLRRYIGEFDFRYSNRHVSDTERTVIALRGIVGKRLLYTTP